MLKCNEDSYSEEEEDEQILIERGLVVESLIEVDHLICNSLLKKALFVIILSGNQSHADLKTAVKMPSALAASNPGSNEATLSNSEAHFALNAREIL